MANYIIGLTGGIGSGKTTVSDAFAKLGIDVVDADVISRHTTSKGQPAVQKIIKRFGAQAQSKPGELNRAWLRKHVFENANAKQWLESLLHPLIAKAIEQALANSSSHYTVFSSPLLLETEQHKIADRILVIDIPRDEQIVRTHQRDDSELETINAIIDKQISRQQRLSMADDIIDNSGTLENTLQQIQQLHQGYLELASNIQTPA